MFFPGRRMSPFAARRTLATWCTLSALWFLGAGAALGQQTEQVYECDLAIVGGGLGGVAAALEGLRAGHKVCLSEITDWLGGQVSQQGVAALDEDTAQRREELFPRGYREFRALVRARYGEPNPGRCWVSTLCFSPQTGALVLEMMLEPYRVRGQLVLLKETVVKALDIQGSQVRAVAVLTHVGRDAQRGANSLPLSHFIEDWYSPEASALFEKRSVRLVPPAIKQGRAVPWVVIDATETGELLPLAGVPYRLGTERRTPWEPGASAAGTDPYCTQSFTYSFAVEKTGAKQSFPRPADYDSPFNAPGYSYEKETFTFGGIFTYRRIKSSLDLQNLPESAPESALPLGEQSLINWTWGNDWRLSTATDNLVLTQAQLEAGRQLPIRTWWGGTTPGNWRGGLRTDALAAAEAHAFGFYYWLVHSTEDRLLQATKPAYRKPELSDYALLRGKESPMGTGHGLSRHPYIREGRRIVGRSVPGYPEGFAIYESDLSGAGSLALNPGRPRRYFDSVGLGQYRLDLHGCIVNARFEASPFEALGTFADPRYPFEIPLRALVPQKIDNLLAGAKNIATTHITNAAYRVHPVEWAVGTAAGLTAAFALERDILPAELVSNLGAPTPVLEALQARITSQGNPIHVP